MSKKAIAATFFALSIVCCLCITMDSTIAEESCSRSLVKVVEIEGLNDYDYTFWTIPSNQCTDDFQWRVDCWGITPQQGDYDTLWTLYHLEATGKPDPIAGFVYETDLGPDDFYSTGIQYVDLHHNTEYRQEIQSQPGDVPHRPQYFTRQKFMVTNKDIAQ